MILDDVAPLLHHLVREDRYQEAIEHLEKHPEYDVACQDAHHLTPLRVLCLNPAHDLAIDLVAKMLQMNPELPLLTDPPLARGYGVTPLHVCLGCRDSLNFGDIPVDEHWTLTHRSAMIVRLMIQAHPKVIDCKDYFGRTILHLLCEHLNGTDDDAAALFLTQEVLEAQPKLAFRRSHMGMPALHWFFYQNAPEVASRVTAMPLVLICGMPKTVNKPTTPPHLVGLTPLHFACIENVDITVLRNMLEVDSAQDLLSGRPYTDTPSQHLWKANGSVLDERIALMALTAFHGRMPDHPVPMYDELVHAICSLVGLPRVLCEMLQACNALETRLAQRDETGNLPLHYAVKGTFPRPEELNDPNMLRRLFDSSCLIDLLVDTYPEAVSMVDSEGRLPLWVALTNHFANWNGKAILKLASTFPPALKRREPSSMLFPALLAATRGNESDAHLSVTFELLLETPEIVRHAVDGI